MTLSKQHAAAAKHASGLKRHMPCFERLEVRHLLASTDSVGHWGSDDDSGASVIEDSFGHGHDGTIQGSTFPDGRLASARRAEGADDDVKLVVMASKPMSDDFTTGTLDPVWTFINPLGDGSMHLTGAGTPNAWLEIHAPAGTGREPWNVNTAPRIMQAADDTDLDLEVRFESALTRTYQEQGIVVEQDSGNYVRFDFFSHGGAMYAYGASIRNASPMERFRQRIAVSLPMYMRVTRVADQWTLYDSGDGSTWSAAGEFTHELTVTQVGVFAGNWLAGTNPAPAHTAQIDYFFNRAAPIIPEDGIVNNPPTMNPGDANRDGQFDSSDLVQVFQAGKYETGAAATWEEGDWTGDGEFDSTDLVAAFQAGRYEQPLAAASTSVFLQDRLNGPNVADAPTVRLNAVDAFFATVAD